MLLAASKLALQARLRQGANARGSLEITRKTLFMTIFAAIYFFRALASDASELASELQL